MNSTTTTTPEFSVTRDDVDVQVRGVHRQYPTGVTVVTASDGGVPFGLAVNAFSSVSLEPPMILVCVNESSKSYPHVFEAEHIGINILASDQVDVAGAFAKSGGDKFANLNWFEGTTGVPVLEGVAGYFELEVKYKIPAYTHTIFLGQVVNANADELKAPLVYQGGSFFDGRKLVSAPGAKPPREATDSGDASQNRHVLARMLANATPIIDAELNDEVFTSDYVRHSGSRDYDLASFQSGLSALSEGFPDMKRVVKDVLIDGDLGSYRWEVTGTHEGTYMGVRSTGKKVHVSGIVQCRFRDGKIAEEWGSWNKASLLHQLGILPLDRE